MLYALASFCAYMFVCVLTCMCIYIWKPEIDIGLSFYSSLSHYLISITVLVWQISHRTWSPRDLFVLPPRTWFQAVPKHQAGESTWVLIIKNAQCFHGPVRNCFTISNVSAFAGPLRMLFSLLWEIFIFTLSCIFYFKSFRKLRLCNSG